jgi:hypothetical protein
VEAHRRGVKVEVVIDKDRVTENYSEPGLFTNTTTFYDSRLVPLRLLRVNTSMTDGMGGTPDG